MLVPAPVPMPAPMMVLVRRLMEENPTHVGCHWGGANPQRACAALYLGRGSQTKASEGYQAGTYLLVPGTWYLPVQGLCLYLSTVLVNV